MLATLVTGLLALSAVGCRSAGSPVAVAPPAPRPAPQITPLQVGDRLFEAGDAENAQEAYAAHLAERGDAADPRALFRLGVLRFRSSDDQKVQSGVALLRRIAARPEHPFRFAAQTLLELEGRRDRLERQLDDVNRQLEALKRIDLDRGRARPPGGAEPLP